MKSEFVCFYHRDCLDGFGAAFAMWLKKGPINGEYVPMQYGEEFDYDLINGRDVYMVDFSAPPEVVMEMSKVANKIVIIDHHESAIKKFEGWAKNEAYDTFCPVELHFDLTHSGAVLTWKYFHRGLETPELLKLIEDRDLWNWVYGDRTKNVNAALWLYPMDFGVWGKLQYKVTKLDQEGQLVVTDFENTLNKLESQAHIQKFAGYDVPTINVTYKFASELGNRLCVGHPFAVMWYLDHAERKIIFSLRSNLKEGGIKVNDLAMQFGGGGHPQAAGMSINLDDPRAIDWLLQRRTQDTTLDSEETPWL